MELREIIDELIKLDIIIQIQDGNLRLNGPEENISARVIEMVKGNKAVIMEYLQAVNIHNYDAAEIAVVESANGYPLSSSQLRLWIVSQLEEASIAYNTPGMYAFEGFLDFNALEISFNEVIRRHESLRTIFRQDEAGEVRQFIQSAEETVFNLQYEDLSEAKEPELRLRTLLREQLDQPFDLEKGPLIRAGLFRLSSNKVIFNYVLHHIITDGWSMDILIRDLILCYNSVLNGESASLPPLRIQYKDYSAWQQQQLATEEYNFHKEYWMKQFAGDLPVLELMGDQVRPAAKTYNGGTVGKRFSATVTEGLRSLVLKQGATLFMGLLGAVNALLYRYTGQEDIVIGSQVAGREHADLEDQIGCYINTLALRTQFNGDKDFRALLDLIKQNTLEAYSHQNYPFNILVDNLDVRSHANRNPLFDVTVVLQNMDPNAGKEDQDLEELKVNSYTEIENVICKFDLSFDFAETGKEMQVNIVYNNDIFNKGTVEQLLNHLELLLSSIIAHPDVPLNELAYLGKDEQDLILKKFNDTAAVYPDDKTITDLFSEQVIRNPHQTAVFFEDRKLTYGELDEKSNQLAAYLINVYSIQTGQPVAIMLDRSEKVIIAILAILKSGGVYVPIDPDYPVTRKEFMIRDADIRVLITQTEYIFDMEYYSGDIFAIDVQMGALETHVDLPAVNVSSGDLAYIMYTSGSTGQPKGVMVEHGNVVRLVKSMNYVNVCESDHFLSISNFSFDGSVFDIFASLLNGAGLIITVKEHLLDFKMLSAIIERYEVSVFFIPTALFNALADHTALHLSGLKNIVVGGERLSLYHVKRFAANYPVVNIINGYGPTENTTFSTYYQIDEVNEQSGTIPIGKPISNSTCFILHQANGKMMIAPVGVVGEICVGGKGLTRGYLNQPGMMEEKFVAHPFAANEKIYRTGDLGRWLADGNIEYIGRKDGQVKISGHRIELGEIEYILQGHPDIDMAVVTANDTDAGTKELVCYLVGKESLSIAEIRSFLSEKLPAYMLPANYIRLNELPLTSNGKVDKKKLTDIGGEDLASGAAYIAPATATERALAGIWEKVLNKKELSIKDDYFELGGNSLTAIIIIKKVIDEMKVSLPLKELFGKRTIERLAQYIDDAEKAPEMLSYVEPSADENTLYDLSYNQRNYFCDWQFGDDLLTRTYEYDALNPEVFEAAVQQLVTRHEILRTEFLNLGGILKQRILPADTAGFEIKFIDAGDGAGLDELIAEECLMKIDPLDSPLIYIRVYKHDNGICHILFLLHHIITDGYSTGIFQEELKQLYTEILTGKSSNLHPLRFQYKDFSGWQKNFVNSDEGERHKQYWLKRLNGFNPKLRLSQTENNLNVNQTRAFCITETITESLLGDLNRFVTSNRITYPVFLKSVLILAIHQLTGQEDITIFTTVSGRNSKYYGELEVGDLIGLFASPLLVRNEISKELVIEDYLQLVLDNFLEDLGHESYPLMKLINELPGFVESGVLDLSVYYNYHNYNYLKEIVYSPESSDRVTIEEADALKNAFGLIIGEFSNSLKFEFVFNPGVFDHDHGMEIKNLFFSILRLIIDHPGMHIGQLDELLKETPQINHVL